MNSLAFLSSEVAMQETEGVCCSESGILGLIDDPGCSMSQSGGMWCEGTCSAGYRKYFEHYNVLSFPSPPLNKFFSLTLVSQPVIVSQLAIELPVYNTVGNCFSLNKCF